MLVAPASLGDLRPGDQLRTPSAAQWPQPASARPPLGTNQMWLHPSLCRSLPTRRPADRRSIGVPWPNRPASPHSATNCGCRGLCGTVDQRERRGRRPLLQQRPLPRHHTPPSAAKWFCICTSMARSSVPSLASFQHCLHHLLEEVVAPQALGFQVPVHAACSPAFHSRMVRWTQFDEGWRGLTCTANRRLTTKGTTMRRTWRRNSATVSTLLGTPGRFTTGRLPKASSAGPVAAHTKPARGYSRPRSRAAWSTTTRPNRPSPGRGRAACRRRSWARS